MTFTNMITVAYYTPLYSELSTLFITIPWDSCHYTHFTNDETKTQVK